MNYLNFDLEAFEHKQTETADQFSVRVANSPAGQQRIGEAEKVKLPLSVRQGIGALQRRQLSLAEIIALGEQLGGALFPPRVRSFFATSLNRLGDEEGLRIRLMLDTYGLESEDILFVDDHEPNIVAARTLGIAVHHFRRADGLRADLVAKGLLS